MKTAHNRVEMIGRQFNSWLVLSHSDTVGKIAYYNCKCVELGCGETYRVDGRNVRNGGSKRCVKCGLKSTAKKQTGKRKNNKPIEEITLHYLFLNKRKDAIKRGFVWELTKEQFAKLVFGNCYYSGLPPGTTVNVLKHHALHESLVANGFITYNGIDRLDSSKGYVMDNVVTCSEAFNKAKLNMSVEEFKAFIKVGYDHMFKKGDK